jgi:hypothetical protein
MVWAEVWITTQAKLASIAGYGWVYGNACTFKVAAFNHTTKLMSQNKWRGDNIISGGTI